MFNDRWEAVPVTPEDNLESWKNWAEGTNSDGLRNICKEVVDFLEKNPREYYNMDDVVAVYQDTYDETQTATTPYPSYRTWEFVSNYLQTKQEKIYLKKTITGLIGDRVGTMFCQYLDSLGWSPKQDDEENTFPNFIEEGISSGTPVMLLTPSGTAKTSTINQVVKKLGYKKITINLAECDRTDLIGAPAKVETSVMVAGEVEGIDKQLAKSLKDAVGNFNLPATVTMKAPKASLVYEFEQAVREKQQILLVFEEANRVNNPAVMGALLQVISDHILFGVKFNPRYVKVICTANIGDNYGDTRGMDAAISARFSIYKQNEYTLSDARRIRKYMKENFSPYIGAYLDTLSDDALLALVSQVESRALEKSVPSTRAWNDLSMYLEDKETNSVVRGKVMFKGTEEAMVLRKANREKQYGPSLKQAVNIIEENLDNWLALDSQLKVHMNVDGDSEAFSVNDLKELFIECKSGLELGDNDLVEPMQSIVQAIAKVDQEAKSMRQKAISFILGDSAQEFCDFYNKVSGSKVVSLDIPDLKDKALIGDYWAQITEGIVSPVDLLGIGLSTVRSINNYFGDNLPVDSYKYYIQYILETYRTADQRLRFLYDLVDDKEVDALISRISDNDEPWIIKITGLAGMQVSKDSLDKLKATTTASKPRFV